MEDFSYNNDHSYTFWRLRQLQCDFNDPYLRVLSKGKECSFNDPYLEILARGKVNIAQKYSETFFNEG